MVDEPVSEIALIDGHLHLVLTTGGRNSYQYVYREAQSVYWDPKRGSFKCSVSIPGLPLLSVFPHMLRITECVGIRLSFPVLPNFVGLDEKCVTWMRAEIQQPTPGHG